MIRYSSAKLVNPNYLADNRRIAGIAKESSMLRKALDEGYKPDSGSLLVETRAISARTNQNYDTFPSKELKDAYQTFKGKPVFVNHTNDDPGRTRGRIATSQYLSNGDDKYISLLIEQDAKAFPKMARSIASGELDSVSMGTDVQFTRCSACDNIAYEIEDFCNHVKFRKGSKVNGINGKRVLVSEFCHKLSFFEISFVFDPADTTAVVSRLYLPEGMKQSRTSSVKPFYVRDSR